MQKLWSRKKHHKKPDPLAQKNLHASAFYSREKSYIIASIGHMLENFDDLKKLWQSCEKRILVLDHIPVREAALEKVCDKMENKIKFAIGLVVCAAILAVTIIIYGYLCGWYAIENKNEKR